MREHYPSPWWQVVRSTATPRKCKVWLSRFLLLNVALLLLLFGAPTLRFAQGQGGISTPASGDTVAGDVIISGTAVIDPFLRYELYYKLEPSGDDAFVYFDGGTNQVVNGQLGIWRTSDLPPGTYSLRLRVVKTDGNYGEFVVSNLNVNVGEVATATPTVTPTSSEPTPTPIPSATFTPAPQPTPILGQITQPQLQDEITSPPSPTPLIVAEADGSNTDGGNTGGGNTESSTDVVQGDVAFEEADSPSTVAASGNSFTRQVGEAVAPDRLREYFFTGMRFSMLLVLAVLILFAGKWLFRWVWTQYR